MDMGAWWAAVYGVAQSRTRLNNLAAASNFSQSPCEIWPKPIQALLTMKNYRCGCMNVNASYWIGLVSLIKGNPSASLVVLWLRICFAVPGTLTWPLVPEDPTCLGATKPISHNYWANALGPTSHTYWNQPALETVLCNERPPQWETHTPQLESSPDSLQLEEAQAQQWTPSTAGHK